MLPDRIDKTITASVSAETNKKANTEAIDMAFAELYDWNTEIGGLEYGNEYDEIGGGTPPGWRPYTGRTAGYSGVSGVSGGSEVRQRSEGVRDSSGRNEGVSSAELGTRLFGEAWRTAETEIVQAEGYESGDGQTRGIRVIKDSSGSLIEHSNLRRSFNRMLARAGVPQRKFHAIRHTFATEAIRHGVDVKDVQLLMGHSNLQTTYIYVQSNNESRKNAIEKMGAIM